MDNSSLVIRGILGNRSTSVRMGRIPALERGLETIEEQQEGLLGSDDRNHLIWSSRLNSVWICDKERNQMATASNPSGGSSIRSIQLVCAFTMGKSNRETTAIFLYLGSDWFASFNLERSIRLWLLVPAGLWIDIYSSQPAHLSLRAEYCSVDG